MQKFTDSDSGGFEAAAVLGEDLGGALALLLGAVSIPVPRHWADPGELSLAGHVVGGLLLVELACLAYAYQTAHVGLGVALVVLLAAELLTLVRLGRPEPEVRFFEELACRTCGESFQVEPMPMAPKGAPPPPPERRDLRRELQVCSSLCAIRQARKQAGAAA